MKILLETANTVLLDLDGRLELLPNNDYTQLRFMKFGGGRIRHDFGDGCVVQETYNRGIYNCECDGELIQVYDGGQLARSILDDDREAYRSIFAEIYGEELEAEVVGVMTASFGERVRRGRAAIGGGAEKDAWMVDDTWVVTADGGAGYKTQNGWHNLCLVADRTESREVVLPGRAKPVRVNVTTWMVLAKILFLLFPHPESVFMGQLPNRLKRMVLAAQDPDDGR